MDPVTWIELILLIVSVIVDIAARPKNNDAKPAALTDFDFPQFDEGTPQCVVFGDCWCPDWMILAYGDYSSQPIRAKTGK